MTAARSIATFSDGAVRIWDLERRAATPLPGHHEGVGAVAMTPDGRRAVAVSDSLVKAWDLESLGEIGALPAPDGSPFDTRVLALSPDGRSVLLGNPLRRWIIGQDTLSTCTPRGWARSWRSRRMATACWPKLTTERSTLWDGASGRQLLRLAHGGSISCVAITPDGTRAITGDYEHDLRVWDLTAIGRTSPASDADQLQFLTFAALGDAAVFRAPDETFRLLDIERAVVVPPPPQPMPLSKRRWPSLTRGQQPGMACEPR